MLKYLSLILATTLSSATITISKPKPIISKLIQSLTTKPIYKNINENFYNYQADMHQINVGANSKNTSNGIIFLWSNYASSWEEFKNNYGSLDLTVNMQIAFDWYNVKWTNSSINVPLDAINMHHQGTPNTLIHEELQTTTQGGRWDGCHASLSYQCFVENNTITIDFTVKTWATNNYDNYYFNIDTQRVTCNATFNYNTIKSRLDQNLNNKTLNLDSDYSTSLQDSLNWPLIHKNINQLVQTALGSYYEPWKSIIYPNIDPTNPHDYTKLPYVYNDNTGQLTLTVKFTDPNNNQQVQWTFTLSINLTLSGEYWKTKLENRLEITFGQVIGPDGKMIPDHPLKPLPDDEKFILSTTAYARFTAAPDGSESMTVNDQPVQVIDNKFSYEMTDSQEHKTNEYAIKLEKHDITTKAVLGEYKVTYVIKQVVPNLKLKWYAWDPENNIDQHNLITPGTPDHPNPSYNPDVNPKTGTISQIMWVKHKAQFPFPLDPIDNNGDKRTTDFNKGLIAEGSVSGMGVNQTFNDNWIKTITREKVDPITLQSISSPVTINSDEQSWQYFSDSGTWHYVISDQKGFTANKFVTIGQNYQNKYIKFLDVLNDPNTAIPFWTTLEGLHLKNYLITNKALNSKDIQLLTFEQVTSYWKEYVSGVVSNHVPPDPEPIQYLDLSMITIDTIKMYAIDVKTIKENIISSIEKQLKKYGNIEYDVDYTINPTDFENNLNQLLVFNNHHSAILGGFSLVANPTSTLVTNSTKEFKIKNSHDAIDNIVDLSTIKFPNQEYDFSEFTTEHLKQFILEVVTKQLKNYHYIDQDKNEIPLVYNTDYEILNIDDVSLQKFLTNKTKTSLTVVIRALDSDTMHAVNSTTLLMINNPDAPPAPPNPPDPKPPTPVDPDNPDSPILPPSGWFTQGKNLAWFLPIAIFGTGGVVLCILWIKYRSNKKIK